MFSVVHPTGNTFVRALLHELHERGALGRFFTTLSAPSPRAARYLPGVVCRNLERRHYDLPRAIISTRPLREAVRLVAAATGFSRLARHEAGWASVDAVYRDLDRRAAAWLYRHAHTQCIKVAHAYEDGALETLRAARHLGLQASYELPIAYWETSQRLLREESMRWPDWEQTLGATRDSNEKSARKTEELNLAETVVCPSTFVLESLPSSIRNSRKCIVAEFGSPNGCLPAKPAAKRTAPLRLIFVGSMSQRKGLADLFSAMKLLRRTDVELVVMGSPVAPMDFYRTQYPEFIYEPPRPHAAVLDLMRSCDVLVLPSIIEGRALVQQEALHCGLPLLVTANAGGADLICEGNTGFLAPIRAPEYLAEKIVWFADHRDRMEEMSLASQAMAASRTWKRYAEKIIAAATE